MVARKPTIGTSVSDDEYARLEAEARREGITISTLVYRRVMNDPTAERRPGRPRRHGRTNVQQEELPLQTAS